MLILNNGVPKSGSTWVQAILNRMIEPAYPSAKWRNGWINPSVDPDRLEAYVASGEWRDSPTLVKMHFTRGAEHGYLKDPDMRILVSYRNIPDSILSWFYMSVQRGQARPEEKQTFLAGEGITFARRLIAHRRSWMDQDNALLFSYEDMLADPGAHVARIAAFLDHPLPQSAIPGLVAATQVKLRPGEKPRDHAHIRTGGRSLGKEEIAAETYERLRAMEAEAQLD